MKRFLQIVCVLLGIAIILPGAAFWVIVEYGLDCTIPQNCVPKWIWREYPDPPEMVPFIPVCYDPERSNPERTLWTEQYEMPNGYFWHLLALGMQNAGVAHAYRNGRIYVHRSLDKPLSALNARGPYRRIQVRWWATRNIIQTAAAKAVQAETGRKVVTGHHIGPRFGVERSDSGVGHFKILRHFFLGPEPWAPEE